MTATCPAGHTSDSEDYCDVCGMPIDSSPGGTAGGPGVSPPPTDTPSQAPAPAGQLCPHCSTENVLDALFCEACGYDFTTGTTPRSATPPAEDAAPAPLTPPEGVAATPVSEAAAVASPPAPDVLADQAFRWVAEVWIDPDWYAVQESPDRLPSAGLPAVVPLRSRSLLVGRPSRSRNISPDIDCGLDSGTSRRQAQLTTDGTRWFVEDLDSANGTFVAGATEPLPLDPIPVGVKHELAPDDRIYVGAWTRLVIREATEDELTSLG